MQLINEASKEKLRGGFYTPVSIAKFILKWGIGENPNLNILEPSCGDGNFLRAIKDLKFEYNHLTAIEYNNEEYLKASSIHLDKSIVINEDFHKYCINANRKYDLIIGNPPYIRYQFFEKEQQDLAIEIFNKSNLKYSKLTNAWVSFVVGATQMLNTIGKIGFVLPAELLQVSYAKQLREFLAKEFNKINIISFEKLVFPDIQQEVVLLLCEKDTTNIHRIDHIELYDIDDLEDFDFDRLSLPTKRIDFNNNKWTYYFLEQDEIDFLENISRIHDINCLGDFAKVEVGITTGANSYFTIPRSTVQEYSLQNYIAPMVGRSVQVTSAIFTRDDWERNYENNKVRSSLVIFPETDYFDFEKGAIDYINFGINNQINNGYKTSIRKNWYCVPSLRVSDALFVRRNNIYPKLVINEANAYTTDTMHRVSVFDGIDLATLIGSYYNSLSFAFAEVSGRSHGGGVLELMPNEAEQILIPYHSNNHNLINDIDSMLRNGNDIQEILNYTNNIILRDNYNFTDKEINLANKIWVKLRDRRLNRK